MSELQEVRCDVDGLEVGMYVCRLDRPWIETPFPMAGFPIAGEDDIAQLRKYCRYVYIDIEIGPAPAPEHMVPVIEITDADYSPSTTVRRSAPSKAKPARKNRYDDFRKHDYEWQVSFEEELPAAKCIHRSLQDESRRILSDLEAGHKLDIEVLRDHVNDTVESIIRNSSALMLLLQLEKSDEYTYNHALGTSVWCAEFGRHLGLARTEISELALGGMLLDVGKIRLPKGVFSKKLFLPDDRKLIRTHVEESLRVLSETEHIEPSVVEMVATHHERMDGTGYPHQLKGGQIPLFGRIAGLVDSYDAMTSRRPYTEKVLSPHRAISEIYEWRDSLFDGDLVEQFIQTVGIYPSGSLVELNSGEVGIVVSINYHKRLSPKVLLILDANKQYFPEPTYLDLARSKDHKRVTKGLYSGAYGIKFEEIQIEGIKTF